MKNIFLFFLVVYIREEEYTVAFSEKIKLEAKRKSAFRCVVCIKPFVEVHHILPQECGGDDTIDNAAPLCASCHDLFGGNPNKRKQIRQMRDFWFDNVKSIVNNDGILNEINENIYFLNELKENKVALYHVVFEDEGFNNAAQAIFSIIKLAQQSNPSMKRVLYLDIDGHKNSMGGYDHDINELQRYFILEFLMPYLSEVHLPQLSVQNDKLQRDDIPEKIDILADEAEVINYIKSAGRDDEIKVFIPKG